MPRPCQGEPCIVATHELTKTFGNAAAVNSINLKVPPGCVYGFLGPNGAGKTTTIRLLLGLLRADHGEVLLFGLNLREHRKALLKGVGALVEAPSIYPRLTGRENLRVLARLSHIRPSRIDEALRLVELSDAAHRVAGQYSQGMKQRLGLAMALLNEPRLLILDEPTNGLDPAGIRDVREMLRRFAAELGITVFLSSHLLSEIELVADYIGIIHQGELLFQGTLTDLRQTGRARTLIRTNDPSAALAILACQPLDCQVGKDGVLELSASDQEQTAMINSMLVQAGLRIYSIENPSHRLEDLFIELTSARAQ